MSRPNRLAAMVPGDRLFLEAPPGRLGPFMQQLSKDIGQVGLRGLVTQSLVLGVQPSTRRVIDLVLVERHAEPQRPDRMPP